MFLNKRTAVTHRLGRNFWNFGHLLCTSIYGRGFFSLRLKNSRAQKLKLKPKNSNSRIFSRKLKHFFRKNSRNRKILRALLPFIINLCSLCIRFCTKTPNYLDIAVKTQRIFENLKETQGLFENSRPK